MPLLIKTTDDFYIFVISISEDEILIYDSLEDKHTKFKIETFLEFWTNEIIMFKPSNKEQRKEKFSLKWFVKPLFRYKKAIIETLTAIFMLQLMGIVSTLIMQVIIDKVLVHNSITTLNIMTIALGIIIAFECIVGFARTYIFTNIISKIDIILGDKLFKSLLNLPLQYFENRRAGDTLSRVREIENVREFITGAPLTVIMDILFLFVYMIVMAYYSKLLTLIICISLVIYVILSVLVIPVFKYMLEEVYEKGAGLSGGQKQRISIARALISNPKILIFDEATSALDYESESIIQRNLKKICEDKTVLIIAHRLSTLKDADKIIVVDEGKIVEFDTHENLTKNKGLYHHLYTMQQRGE